MTNDDLERGKRGKRSARHFAVLWRCCGSCVVGLARGAVVGGAFCHKNVLGEEGVGMHARRPWPGRGREGFLGVEGTLVGMREHPWGGVLDLWADTAG
jgi:hypothetical protein